MTARIDAMDINNLVDMANRIGEFFQPVPDQAEAMEGIATHLVKFWAPRMRKQLGAHLDAHDGEGLSPLVREALRVHRSMLE